MNDEKKVCILRLSYGDYVSLDNFVKLQQENERLKESLSEIKNLNEYVYQDGIGEDWYFQDLDIYNIILEIVNKSLKDDNKDE